MEQYQTEFIEITAICDVRLQVGEVGGGLLLVDGLLVVSNNVIESMVNTLGGAFVLREMLKILTDQPTGTHNTRLL